MKISKILSINDVGKNKSHQAGILVPKNAEFLTFFPSLDSSKKNPRKAIIFEDTSGKEWEFMFIYYNNKFFGGTRNEYRLTRMTGFFRYYELEPEDELFFSKGERDTSYQISYNRKKQSDIEDDSVLRVSRAWKVVSR